MTKTPFQQAIEYLLAHGSTLEQLGVCAKVTSTTAYRWRRGIVPHVSMQKPIFALAAKRRKAEGPTP